MDGSGTRRVFVQGLPMNFDSWTELKDHFRVAGEVAYASVSTDRQTGEPKGCGIVEFESVKESNNAIKIMRDHPLHGKHDLYVRRDVQETGRPQSAQSSSPSSLPSSVSKGWKCANDKGGDSGLVSGKMESIQGLLRQRNSVRRNRLYESANAIREELKSDYRINLDDQLKQYWLTSEDGTVPKSVVEKGRETRTAPSQKWQYANEEEVVEGEKESIMYLIQAQDKARLTRDYNELDKIQESLKSQYQVFVDDKIKTWWIATKDELNDFYAVPEVVLEAKKQQRPNESLANDDSYSAQNTRGTPPPSSRTPYRSASDWQCASNKETIEQLGKGDIDIIMSLVEA